MTIATLDDETIAALQTIMLQVCSSETMVAEMSVPIKQQPSVLLWILDHCPTHSHVHALVDGYRMVVSIAPGELEQ